MRTTRYFNYSWNLVLCTLLCSYMVGICIATPVPLSIFAEEKLSGDYTSIETLKLTFKGAQAHLKNLADILRPVPNEAPNSITAMRRQVLVQRTFGRLDDVKLNFVRQKVEFMLGKTAKLKVGKVRVDYAEMDAQSREDEVLAGYSEYYDNVEFTAFFYDMASQRCREHALIHEAAHAFVKAFDFFKEIVPNPKNPDVFYFRGSHGPESEPEGTELLSGYEHEDLEELIEFGDGITIYNAESYGQAAIRATQIKELGHNHADIQLPSFEDCVPGPPRPPGSVHPIIKVWRWKPAVGTTPAQPAGPPRTRLHRQHRHRHHSPQASLHSSAG